MKRPRRTQSVDALITRWTALVSTMCALISVAVALGALRVAVDSQPSPDTMVRIFDAGDFADLTPSVAVQADCLTMSFATTSADARRCFVGNQVHDPCFTNEFLKQRVACPQSSPTDVLVFDARAADQRPPAATTTTAVDPGGPPGITSNAFMERDPWFLVLADGWLCRMVTGASADVGGYRISFGCHRNDESADVLGVVDRTRAVWSVLLSSSRSSTGFQQVEVRAAWF